MDNINDNINDDIIKQYFFDTRGHFIVKRYTKFIKNVNTELYSYLTNRYNDSSSLKESIYRIKYGIENRPVCEYCGGYVEFKQGKILTSMYRRTCSTECEYKLISKKSEYTCIKRYNAISWSASDEGRKRTSLIQQRKEVRDKYNKTCEEHFGVKNPMLCSEILEKRRQHNIDKYGVESPLMLEEIKNTIAATCKRRYPNGHPAHSKGARLKAKKTMNLRTSDEIQKSIEKSRNTSLKHFNETHWSKTEYGRKFFSDLMTNKEERKRRRDVMRKNGTIGNKSKQEDIIYELIKEKYPDVKRQYDSDDRYPFLCDFYIPILDMFIECNFHWTHHYHPYNINSKEDQDKLSKLSEKAKTSTFYKNSIAIWTKLDPLKRKTAKDNNLNYVELWSVEEAKEWVKSL